MVTMLQNIPGTVAFLVDVFIMGTEYADLEKDMDMLIRCITHYRFGSAATKHDFNIKQVRYLGFITDRNERNLI